MIKEISFKNYKAFDFGKIELKPITVLLGANSVGKSSIIQLLLLLQQTAETQRYKSALKLHGEYVSLGENENLFKDKDTSKDIIITFQFEDTELLNSFKGEFLKQLTHSIIAPIEMLQRYYIHSSKKVDTSNVIVKKTLRNILEDVLKSKESFLTLINQLSSLIKDPTFMKDLLDNDLMRYRERDIKRIVSRSHLIKDGQNDENYGNIYDVLKSTTDLKSNIFELSFSLTNIKTKKEDVLKVNRIKLSNSKKKIIDLVLEIDKNKKSYSNLTLTSDFTNSKEMLDKKTKGELLQTINYNSTLFYLFSPIERNMFSFELKESSPIISLINDVFCQAILGVRQSFNKEMINYVSPLRAHPKRYYFLDKAKINTFLDTLDGDSLTEILKENNVVKNKVNNWLENFNLSIDVSTLQDVIHKLKVSQSGLDLDITDVGFGISQVLPVIVQGFLSFEKSLTIIEQPEIHLHPKMQADLADLFIDISLRKTKRKMVCDKFLLIETHSEYLLKRLRRRMAENEKINSENVAIYYFHPRNETNAGIIERKEINDTGFFEYPKDFYSGELLRDNTEFLKHQIKNRK